MTMNATELRKDLFNSLDMVIRGEPVLVTYKGVQLRLVAAESQSKLARAVRRHALLVDPDSIVASDTELKQALDAKWAEEDKQL